MKTLETLRQTNPEIAISVTWTVDEYFQWDGDGPDPTEEGYLPYNVTVWASRIVAGKIQNGVAHLGGCYSQDGGKDDPEISGYLDQLIDEALADLG